MFSIGRNKAQKSYAGSRTIDMVVLLMAAVFFSNLITGKPQAQEVPLLVMTAEIEH